VVKQSITFKFEQPRISKPRFASQVEMNNDLPKPVITHYFPKEKESAFAKPYHMTVSSEYRSSSKNMPRFTTNDMVHNHYLEEAKKETQERGKNSRPSKCVFNANHDACVTKFLNEVNSRAKVPSYKTTNRNKPEKQISVAKKPER
nr:hypothetical protein [Tanacetum cinerariifolium]